MDKSFKDKSSFQANTSLYKTQTDSIMQNTQRTTRQKEQKEKDPMAGLTVAQRRKMENDCSLFELQEITDIFKPVNRMRKIFYPQVMKKFDCNKPERIYVDDFRYGLEEIIKQPDMDQTFEKFLKQ